MGTPEMFPATYELTPQTETIDRVVELQLHE